MRLRKYISQHKLLPVNAEDYSSIRLFAVSRGEAWSCAGNAGLISLKPLTVAFHEADPWYASIDHLIIKEKKKELARIKLSASALSIKHFSCYNITGTQNFVRGRMARLRDRFFIGLKNRIQKKTKFSMGANELIRLFDFCLYPRRVYMVCTPAGHEILAFPIDVTGIYPGGRVLLSIRKSNRANESIISSGKLALCSMPYSETARIYSLGKNSAGAPARHAETTFEWYKELPYPVYSLTMYVLALENYVEAGEHLCFVCHIEETRPVNEGGQLAHLPWYRINAGA